MNITRDDAWVYTRRSRVSADQASVSDQEAYGREAVAEHGWNLRGVLSEEKSASRYGRKERTDWAELLRLVRAGEVGILILWESNRGDRTLTTWSGFLDLCRETGTRIYIIEHGHLYDLANSRDWRTLAEDGVSNAYFSEQQSAVTRRGKRLAMRKGRPASPVPYGYEVHYNPATGKSLGWKVIPEKSEAAREIVRRVGRAEVVTQIAADLNGRGILSPLGGLWDRSSIRQVASNPAYAGLVRLHDGRYAPRQPQVDKDGNDTGEQWPPIVTRAEWEDAVAVLSSRATGQRPGAARHLLAGIAKCECGGWLRGHPTGYACRNSDLHILREVNDFVRDVICTTLSLDDAQDLFMRDDSPRVAILESEVKELEDRRGKYRKKAALGQITDDALAEIEATISEEIRQREREMSSVRRVPALAGALAADDVRLWWDAQELQARREVIAALTSITIRGVPRRSTAAVRTDWAARVVFDWVPQPPKRGPGGRVIAGSSVRPELPGHEIKASQG